MRRGERGRAILPFINAQSEQTPARRDRAPSHREASTSLMSLELLTSLKELLELKANSACAARTIVDGRLLFAGDAEGPETKGLFDCARRNASGRRPSGYEIQIAKRQGGMPSRSSYTFDSGYQHGCELPGAVGGRTARR